MSETRYKNPPEDGHRAKQLRKQAPLPERLLWRVLSELRKSTGLRFRRQHPIHPYIVDFAYVKGHLAIELDGPSHDMRQAQDLMRTRFLEKEGWKVIRFGNQDVLKNLDGVVATILEKVKELEAAV